MDGLKLFLQILPQGLSHIFRLTRSWCVQLRARKAATCEDNTCQGSGQRNHRRQGEVSVQAHLQAFMAEAGIQHNLLPRTPWCWYVMLALPPIHIRQMPGLAWGHHCNLCMHKLQILPVLLPQAAIRLVATW